MRFAEIPIGTFFQLDYQGLPTRLVHARRLRPFRKVAEDGAVDIADRREFKWYMPSATQVVQIQPQHGGKGSAALLLVRRQEGCGTACRLG